MVLHSQPILERRHLAVVLVLDGAHMTRTRGRPMRFGPFRR
jgi:hypothetical protein